jgi:crossover junction endodeoxyribonuclease RuvC
LSLLGVFYGFLFDIGLVSAYTSGMRILGIDPGMGITGYGMIEARMGRISLLEGGVIRTKGTADTAVRLGEIFKGITEIITQFSPDVLAVENLYSHYAHPTTAIIMGHARGIIFLAAAEAGLKVNEYASTRVKKSLTGNGRATKSQVQQMVKSLLSLGELPEPNDVADAIAIAVCHARVEEKGETLTS